MYKKFFKRFFGFLFALISIIVLLPVFLILSLLVLIFIGKPIFFKQERTTINKKKFFIIKFRTMTNEKDSKGKLLPDDKRLTKFGHFLRTTSLDELPELLNIIKGDMAFIGPRPLPNSYIKFYKDVELTRFDVRGGLIPPDSVDRNAVISWDKQFEYEKEYAKNVTIIKDFKILIGVFRIIFQRNKTDYGSYVRLPLDVERKDMIKKED